MSELPPCETCGAVADQFKVPLYSVGSAPPAAFICTECDAITQLTN